VQLLRPQYFNDNKSGTLEANVFTVRHVIHSGNQMHGFNIIKLETTVSSKNAFASNWRPHTVT
jgi:hypothetical protein